MTRPGAVALAVALAATTAALTVTGAGGPAAAQTIGTDPGEGLELTVTELTGVLGPGSQPAPEHPDLPEEPALDLELRVLVEHLGERPLPGLRLVVEVHPAVTARSVLEQTLADGPSGAPLHVHDQVLGTDGTLLPGEAAGAADRFTPAEVAWRRDPGGVHPVRIAVVQGTRVLREVTTAVVWLQQPPEAPLRTTVVYPITAPPWRAGGGGYLEASDRELEDGGRLDLLLRALERHPTAPVTLALSAHLLEDLADRADGYEVLEQQDDGTTELRRVPPDGAGAERAATALGRLRQVGAGVSFDPITGPYADADLSALLREQAALRELAGPAAADGRRRTQRLLGRTVDSATTVLTDPVDPAVLDVLPGDVVVLPYAAGELPDLAGNPDLDEPVRSLVSPAGRRLTALVADPQLSEALTVSEPPGGPVLAVQRLLAGSALVHLAAPGRADRGLVLLPEPRWRPTLRHLDLLLPALAEAPWLAPSGPAQVAVLGRRATEPLTLRSPDEPGFDPGLVDALATALTDLAALSSALPEGSPQIEGRSVTELEDQLLRATSRWWRVAGGGTGLSLVSDVQQAIDTTIGEVELTASSVTLTSDSGSLPVTVQRTRGGPVLVQVEVASQGRLRFPEGRRSPVLELASEDSQTVTFDTRALSTGTFPVTVRVVTPDGARELARTSLAVRSTAVSRPALAAIAGLVLVLLLIGSLRRSEATATRPPGGDTPPRLRVLGGGPGEPEPPSS